jgi:hypothetical protein
MNNILLCTTVLLMLALASAPALTDDFDVDWYTIDGGGEMRTVGGDYELSGTIGQPDAGVVMTGGDYELTGGFWPGVPPYQPGDLNCDGLLNTFDIDPFVLALTDPDGYEAAYPDCERTLADINGDGMVNVFDIDPFVMLLTGDSG